MSVAILLDVDNHMDIDKIDDSENMDDKEDDAAAMDNDSDDLYPPTSQPSSLLTPTSDDMEFLASLDETFFVSNASFDVPVKRLAPQYPRLKRHHWLQQALVNEVELLVNELEAGEIGLVRWEEFFWIERITMRDDEDRFAGQ